MLKFTKHLYKQLAFSASLKANKTANIFSLSNKPTEKANCQQPTANSQTLPVKTQKKLGKKV